MKYGVTIPIAGYCYIIVDANSTKEAEDIAMENCNEGYLEEWVTLKSVIDGNVCHFPFPQKIQVEEI